MVPKHIVDVLIPLIMEEIVEIIKVVLQERISERIREQTVDVHVPRVVEQVSEVPKTSSRDRTLQCAAEQNPNVPVPKMVTQLLEVPKIIPQDRILKQTYSSIQEDSSAALWTSTDLNGFELVILVRRLAEQEHGISATMKFGAGADGDPSVKVKNLITDLISRLQAEASFEKREDLEADVAKHSSKLEAAVARSIDGDISTQQVVNTHVQHVVNTVEVEMPKIIKETVQRKRPIIQEKIDRVTKHIKIPQVQFRTKVDDMPVAVQRQTPTAQTVQKVMEVPQLQFTNKVNDIPVEAQRQISMVRAIQKTTDIPQLQCDDHVVDVPAEMAVQAPHVHVVAETAETLQLPLVSQIPQAHVVEKTAKIPQMQTVEKIGETSQTQMILSARTSESSVTAPVLENSPVVAGSVQPAHVVEDMALAHTVSCTTRPLPATTMVHRLVDENPTDDMVSEIRDLKSDLVHIRELLGVLVRKERSAEAKAEIAARRLNRMERERDHDRNRCVGTSRERRCSSPGGVSSQTSLGTRRVASREEQGESEQGGPTSETSSGTDC